MSHEALLSDLLAISSVASSPLAIELAHVVSAPTGVTSAGYPFLSNEAWLRFRDRVPHILAMGPVAIAALDVVVAAADALDLEQPGRGAGAAIAPAVKVVRGCVLTAAVTAPSDLWLCRYVIGTLGHAGLAQRLLDGEALDVAAAGVDPRQLQIDLELLLSRGLVTRDDDGRFSARLQPTATATLAAFSAPPAWPADVSHLWAQLFRGERLPPAQRAVLLALGQDVPARTTTAQDAWWPTAAEVEAGARLVPLVLGLRASGRHTKIAHDERIDAASLAGHDRPCATAALAILRACGVIDDDGVPTTTGRRVAEKGAGPMGIIEAYHPYMQHLDEILVGDSGSTWVTRGANIAASQDANHDSFRRANDALDAFVADTGFSPTVFIEHAIGRGEATRQRYARPGGSDLRYFGADLEDAAIDACLEEQRAGRLPQNMVFVRAADIGVPSLLVEAINDAGAVANGAVMIVGNGFHEVREQTDARMIEVFRGYADAGIVMLFTEESALRVDDLLATAWNTYHAGFRYVHEKSGQGLRPAEPAPPSTLGHQMQKSWRECAEAGGYVRLDRYSSKSRTVYPLTTSGTYNPAISANHFCVPQKLAVKLGLT